MKRLADGLFRFAGKLWHRAKTRRPHDCLLCKRPIPKGATVIIPLTNDMNRSDRICWECAENNSATG